MQLALYRALGFPAVLVALVSGCDPNPDAPSAPSEKPAAPSPPGVSKVERTTRQVGPPLGTTSQ